MEVSSIAVRSGVLLHSLLALSASVTELIITSQPDGTRRFCAFFLCDEQPILKYAYKQQLEGENSNLNAAIETLRGVVSRNPASAERWVDLGDAFAAAGFTKNAEFCMARALELGSHSADVLVPAGTFYLA